MYKRRRRDFGYVVSEQDEVQKLLNFTNHTLVRGFAYIKHTMKNNGNTHYHFYFILNGMCTSYYLEKLTGVSMKRIFFARDTFKAELDYMLRAGEVDIADLKSFRTNIDGYKKYNGV